MLDLWIDKQPYASWNQLIDALRSPGVEMINVASKIEGMLIESNGGMAISVYRSTVTNTTFWLHFLGHFIEL